MSFPFSFARLRLALATLVLTFAAGAAGSAHASAATLLAQDAGSLRTSSVPLAGGSISDDVFGVGGGGAAGLAYGDGYWWYVVIDGADEVLMKAPAANPSDGSVVKDLGSSENIGDLAVGGGYVFYNLTATGAIGRIDEDGNGRDDAFVPAGAAGDQGNAWWLPNQNTLLAAGGRLYWLRDNEFIDSVAFDDGSDISEVYGIADRGLSALAASPTTLYFNVYNFNDGNFDGTNVIDSMPLAGGPVSTGTATPGCSVTGMAADADYLYYAQPGCGAQGALGRLTLSDAAENDNYLTLDGPGYGAVALDEAAPTADTLPSVPASATEGTELDADPGVWAGDSSPITDTYQWQTSASSAGPWTDIGGATTPSYTPADADSGSYLRVEVTAANDDGETTADSNASGPVQGVPPTNTDQPTWSETDPLQVVGTAYTADPGSWTPDGALYSYQWQRSDDDINWQNIDGATSAAYTATAADDNDWLRVAVTASDLGGSATAYSDETAEISYPPPTATGPVALDGTPQVGQPLDTDVSGAFSTSAGVTYFYQWSESSDGGSTFAPIGGATGASYSPQASDAGMVLMVDVTAYNDGGSADAYSLASAPVEHAAPANTALPAITGNLNVGQTLTASTGTWTGGGLSYTYRWQRSDGEGGWLAISGATTSAYTLSAADQGANVRVQVTASNDGGGMTVNSAAAGPVPDAAPSGGVTALDGTANVGQALTADVSGVAGNGITYTYAWQRSTDSGAHWQTISGATGQSYTLTAADDGAVLQAVVTAQNGGGSDTIDSAPSNPVTYAAPIGGAPALPSTVYVGLSVEADPDGFGFTGSELTYTYQWQQSVDDSDNWTDIAGATNRAFMPTSAEWNQWVRVQVTATNDGGALTATSDGAYVHEQNAVVESGTISNITMTSAIITGSVNPMGVAWGTEAQYGTTTGYGTNMQGATTTEGFSAQPVSINLAGLLPGTTYHVRLAAGLLSRPTVDAADISVQPARLASLFTGEDVTFTTAQAPSAQTDTADAVTTSGATLHGEGDGYGTDATAHFEWGTTTAYGNTTPEADLGSGSIATAAQADLTGLTANATYHYRLVVTSQWGTTDGSDQTLNTSAQPMQPTPPPAPTAIGTAAPVFTGAGHGHGAASAYVFSAAKTVVPAGTTIAAITWTLQGKVLGHGQTLTYTFPVTATVQTYTLTLTVALSNGQSASTVITVTPKAHLTVASLGLTLHFAAGSAKLTATDRRQLDRIRAFIKTTQAQAVTIAGYTDSTGSPVVNRRLSLERARTVLAYLFGAHPPADLTVRVIGVGAARFVASNATAAGRARNRRVTVKVTGTKTVA